MRELRVSHYGPDFVPDPDCTTFIRFEDPSVPPPRQDFMALNNDAELTELIDALVNARDNHRHLGDPEPLSPLETLELAMTIWIEIAFEQVLNRLRFGTSDPTGGLGRQLFPLNQKGYTAC